MKKITFLVSQVKKTLLVVSLALLGMLPINAFAQTDVSTEQGLKDIALGLTGSYRLTADITVTTAWTPIVGFGGTLNGNGHIIKGLTFNNVNTNAVGLFASTIAGASITKLGIENANLIGNADVGGIVGIAIGTTITESYVANSYIEGRDHVGAITGALKSTSLIENCYATAEVASRSSQSGGFTGILLDGSINKCYFSGLVYNIGGGSNSGEFAPLLDGGSVNVITNSVALSPYIVGGAVGRILGNINGKPITLTNNFALDTFVKGANTSSLTLVPSTDVNVGADKIHGANVTKALAQTSAFYGTTLGWDMTNTWTILAAGQIYPTLKWQQSPVAAAILGVKNAKKSIALAASITILPFGSMGQVVTVTNPTTTFFTSTTVDGRITYTGSLAGTTAVTATSATQTNLAAVTNISFDLEVFDPTVEIQITTATDLVNIKNNLSRKFILMNDIDVSSIASWTPIAGFGGSLNGNGHIIKGLTFSSTNQNMGLFSSTTSGAVITKLGIENARFVGNSDVAALVGNANNTSITECYVTNSYIEGSDHVGAFVGNLNSGSVIRNCYSTATIVSRSSQAGGFVGVDNNATIDRCFFSGTVTTNSSNTGGFISLLEGATNITNSVCLSPYIIGGAIGRIVGSFNGNTPTLTNNYGLDEFQKGNSLSSLSTMPVDDVNIGTGKLHGANVTKAVAQTSAFYTTLGWDMAAVWTIAAEGQVYPMLKWQHAPVATSILGVTTDKKTLGIGTSMTVKAYGSMGQTVSFTIPTNTVLTSTASGSGYTFTGTTGGQVNVNITSPANAYLAQADLAFIMEVFDPNATLEIKTTADLINIKNNLARNYILKNDLDLSSIADWTPLGTSSAPFTGIFDGGGFTITKLKINQSGTGQLGLFGVTSGCTIKKLALTQVNVIGNSDAGGLIGKASGTSVSQVFVTGRIEGNDHVGAIIGGTNGGTPLTTITNCYANATVSTRSSQVGGLAGAVSSFTMTNSYFTGTVTAPTTDWTKNSGGLVSITEDGSVSLINSVSAATIVVGGTNHPFVARNAVTITNCLYRSDMVVDPLYIGVNVGTVLDATAAKSLANLQLESTYSAAPMSWNFTTIWKINANEFPTLIGIGAPGIISEVPGINATAKNYKAYSEAGEIHVIGAKNTLVKVYNLSGVLVAQLQPVANDAVVKLSSKGIYLVRIVDNSNAATTVKVINN